MTLLKLVVIISVCKEAFAGDGVFETLEQKAKNTQQNIWELSGKFQGDIVFSKNQRNGIVYTQYRWPGAIFPYEINQTAFDSAKTKLIEDAIAIIANATCIKPRRRLSSDVDYVYFTNNEPGCWSYIGKTGNKQNLNLGNGCLFTKIIVHEVVHALGFFHQQSDSTRDNYVTIHLGNVQPGYESNFNKYPSNVVTSFGEPYDYDSITHYSRKAFSANGQDTIVPINPNAQIGVANQLSAIDIRKIKKMYSCP